MTTAMTYQTTTVEVQGHAYRVNLGPKAQPRYHVVRKDRSCDCKLGKRCPAVSAVSAYLRSGGQRAPDPRAGHYWTTAPEQCPVCNAPATPDWALNSRWHGRGWRCTADAVHHWEARARWLREAQARANAISPDYSGLPGVPRQTAEERAAFIEAHRLDYNVWA